MSWFKLDDGFHCHPKVLEAGNEAVGLYVRCGSWVSQQLTNGFVPTSIALLYGGRELAEVLVEVRLWIPVSGGWQMHDYLTYNPSKDQVHADRHAAAERQKRARERAKAAREAKEAAANHHGVSHAVTHYDSHGISHGVTHGVTATGDALTSSEEETAPQNPADSHAVTAPVSHAPVTPVVTVPPTRPDPTRPGVPTEHPGGVQGGFENFMITADAVIGVEADFEIWWKQWPRKIAKQAASDSYAKARRKKIPADVLLSTAAQQLAAWRATGRPKDKVPHATTWLNQERWNDEVERPRFHLIEGRTPGSAADSPWATDLLGRSS